MNIYYIRRKVTEKEHERNLDFGGAKLVSVFISELWF